MNSAASPVAPAAPQQAVHTFMYPRVSQVSTSAHTVLASSLAARVR